MNRKNPAVLLSLALILSLIVPAAPAVAANIESAPTRANIGAALTPKGLTNALPTVSLPVGQMTLSPVTAPSIEVLQEGTIPHEAAPAAAQAAKIQAAQATAPVPAVSAANVQAAAATTSQASPTSLLGRLSAAVSGKISWLKAFDGAGMYHITGRPLPKPVLPNGASIEIGSGPTVPPVGHGKQVTLNNFGIPDARNVGSGNIFEAGPRVLDVQAGRTAEATEAAVKQALLNLVDGDAARYGVTSAELETVHVRLVKGQGSQADTVYAYFRQQKKSRNVDGAEQNVRVNGSYLSFTVKFVKGKAVLMAAMARLYPDIDAGSDAQFPDDQLKSKAAQQLPQDAGLELVFVERKIIFHQGRWRTVNLYDIEGAPIAIGINVAVDVKDGEVFAWDSRVGLIKDHAPKAAQSGKFILHYGGRRIVTAEDVAQITKLVEQAGGRVTGGSHGRFSNNIFIEGDEAAMRAVAAQVGWSIGPAGAITGTITGRAEENDHRPGNVISVKEQALPHIEVTIGGKKQNADVDGNYSASAPAGVQAKSTLSGRWAKVNDQQRHGLEVSATLKPDEQTPMVFNPNGVAELDVDQVNAYLWVTKIHDWWSTRLQGDKRIDRQIPVNVNIDDECNAYYTPGTPSLNFFRSSANCSDTGRPGVVAHEYGHSVDDAIGGITNGGMSEGWGDIGSMYLLNTPIIGEGFLKHQDPSWIRHGENNYQYKEGDEVHDQGQAWMGFAWKLRKSLIASLGEAAGTAEAEALIIPTLFAKASDIPSQMAQVLLGSMDKDGKIRYEKEIRAAARAHHIELPGNPGIVSRLWNGLVSTLLSVDVEKVDAKAVAGRRSSAPGDNDALMFVPVDFAHAPADASSKTVLRITARRFSRDGVREFIQNANLYRSSEYAPLSWHMTEDRGLFGSEFIVELSGSRKAVDYMMKQLRRFSEDAVEVPAQASPIKVPTGPLHLTAPEQPPQAQPPRLEDLIASLKIIGIEAAGSTVEDRLHVTVSKQEDLAKAVAYMTSRPEWKDLYAAGKLLVFFKPADAPAKPAAPEIISWKREITAGALWRRRIKSALIQYCEENDLDYTLNEDHHTLYSTFYLKVKGPKAKIDALYNFIQRLTTASV